MMVMIYILKKFWKDNDLKWYDKQKKSIKKLKRLIKKSINKDTDKNDDYFNKYTKQFGFGEERTIIEYLIYLGIDPSYFSR